MSDHNFEKKIQQKMDELKLTPSAGVWMSVEKNIKSDKRRRRAIFWLPLFFLLLGGSGYFLLSNHSSSNTSTKNTITSSNTTQKNQPVANNENTGKSQTADTKNKEAQPSITAMAVEPSHGAQVRKHPQGSFTSNDHTTAKRIAGPSTKKVKEPVAKDNTSNGEPSVTAEATAKAVSDVSKSASSDPTPLDSAQQVTAKNDIVDSASKKTDAIAAAKEKPRSPAKNSSKWKFGLMGDIGMSKTVESIFSHGGEKSLQYSLPPAGAATGGNIYGPPSPVNPGFTFSIGGFAAKPISKRVDISIGLAYTYMSTTTFLGNRVDSARLVSAGSQIYSLVSNYYPNSNKHPYTNSYHFIEVPITIEWKFNEKKKLPFSWASGLQLMQMFSTNAVHYDGSHGIYFENSSYFNKTQLGIFTGLSFETFRNSKHPLWIGPRVDYLMSDMLKSNYSDNRHLFSAGITAKMFLKK